jgi:hypothetical protein
MKKEKNQVPKKILPRYFWCQEYLSGILFAALKIEEKENDKEQEEVENDEEEEKENTKEEDGKENLGKRWAIELLSALKKA